MSEIPRYKMEFAPGSGGWIKQTARGELVLFTDHEAAIALRTRVCAEAFEDELARTEERVLADAKARIEDLHYGDDNLLIGTGYQLAVNDALAALTQPQTEKCPQCGGDGKGPLTHHFGEPCPTCDGGGAATPRGVADADLVRVGDFFGIPAFTHPDVKPGIVGIVSAGEVTATITGTAPQRPKADPKEVHSCHADCPCQSGGEPLRDFVAPVPHTEGEKERPGVCVEHGTWNINECEYGQCPQCGDKLVPTDTEGAIPTATTTLARRKEPRLSLPPTSAWSSAPARSVAEMALANRYTVRVMRTTADANGPTDEYATIENAADDARAAVAKAVGLAQANTGETGWKPAGPPTPAVGNAFESKSSLILAQIFIRSHNNKAHLDANRAANMVGGRRQDHATTIVREYWNDPDAYLRKWHEVRDNERA